ncbi:hypothetical protein [Mucisphaera sp.]|uniref:hypothetical protein n=1 Tax=Mucisphaera sp. TaxID=2913024 RepID=UPI003D0B00DF
MTEWSPTDLDLLRLKEDAVTGIPLIETGESPYYLSFRRMVERLARVPERANDLRVYQDGSLSLGVRAGRCRIEGADLVVAGQTGIIIEDEATTSVWIDATGLLNAETTGFPADRHRHLRLAQVVATGGEIQSITDLRGACFLHVPDPASLGLAATAAEIDQALSGIGASVTAARFDTLCGGADSEATNLHTHSQWLASVDGEMAFTIRNLSADPGAGAALGWSVPNRLANSTVLRVLPDSGWLEQEIDGETYGVVGGVPLQWFRSGPLTSSVLSQVVGLVPCDGVIDSVSLVAGSNLETSVGADQLSVTLRLNGVPVTDLPASLRVSDGAGYRNTDRGDGEAAHLFGGALAEVRRGDVIKLDLIRQVNGVVSSEAEDVGVLVVLRSSKAV